MRENMERSYGLYFSQRVLTAPIATGLPRQQAYEAVQRLAMQSWESRTPFPELVRADADMSSRLGEAALAELLTPPTICNTKTKFLPACSKTLRPTRRVRSCHANSFC